MAKTQARKVLHENYQLVNGERSENGLYWRCVYCGQPATERDHCPPISRVYDYRALGHVGEYLLVPACKNCNAILRDTLQENIFERIEFLKDELTRKNKRIMHEHEWDEDELREMGRNMKTHIKQGGIKAKLIKSRVEYYGGYDALQDYFLN